MTAVVLASCRSNIINTWVFFVWITVYTWHSKRSCLGRKVHPISIAC